MNDPVRRARDPKLHSSCHPEASLSLPAKIQSKLASGGRVFWPVSNRRPSELATGIALLLCLVLAGCTGFFISPSISSVFITPAAATIAVNGTQQLIATGTFSDGSKTPLTGSTVGWSSSDDTIATITNGGLVTGVGTGTATMTASAEGVSGTANVTVTVQNLTSIVITTTQGSTNPPSGVTITGVPATLQFYAYANGSASQDITNAVTWSSSNTGVATISTGLSSGSGLATSVATGTTVITASSVGSLGTVTSNRITLTVQ
jgi:Bacterial Ig-like domain (group 2)